MPTFAYNCCVTREEGDDGMDINDDGVHVEICGSKYCLLQVSKNGKLLENVMPPWALGSEN